MAVELDRIDIYDPDGYVASPQHEVFEHLRRTQPVYWQDMPDGPGYWAVMRHADVLEVAREPLRYSASEGGVVLEDLPPEQLEQMRGMLLAMDPPRHVDYRRNISPHFKNKVIGQLEDNIRGICRAAIGPALDRDEVEFVHEVTALLPSQVVGELMGLPADDWHKINDWAEQSTGSQDPDINPDSYMKSGSSNGSMMMAMYGIELAATRRANPDPDRVDLTELILASEVDGAAMTDLEFGRFFVQLVTAGNDTTKTMLSSGVSALLDHPDQLAELRADRSLIPGAVEEILRWANPLHYFRRTATEDCVLGGQAIQAGDKVAMMYTSANRDEAVFADPHRFDIHRSPNPHLSFGFAEHFCLGVHLARLEGKVFIDELLTATSSIERTGEPKRIRSNLNNALTALPLRLQAA
jgi:cytochrome P450